jgi:flavodoxin
LKILLALFILAAFAYPIRAQAANSDAIVLYFSWSGNAKAIAALIGQKISASLVEIKARDAYPTDYNACVAQAKEELRVNARPAILADLAALADYSTVILVAPNWWSHLPTPVMTALEKGDFKGKAIYLVVTHGGSGLSQTVADATSLAKGAQVKGSLAIYGSGGGSLSRELDEWLKKNGLPLKP